MPIPLRLEPIIALLQSPNEADRQQGIMDLVQSRDPMAATILSRIASNDPSVQIRYYSRRALDALRTREDREEASLPPSDHPLAEMLSAGDPKVRFAGLRRALETGGDESLRLLREAVPRENVPQLLASLLIGLGRLGNADDIPLLGEFLGKQDSRIRANAVEALATIGTPEALERIVPLLSDEDNRVKANVTKALQAFGGIPLFHLLEKMALQGEIWMRDSALYALACSRTPAALRVIGRVAARDPLERLREKALQMLRLMAERQVVGAADILAEVSGMPAAPFPDGREAQIQPAFPPTAQETDELAELLRDDRPARRQLGVLRLIRRASPEDEGLLVEMLGRETEPYLLAELLAFARHLPTDQIFAAILPFLQHSNDRVRANAAETLSQVNPAAAVPHLHPLLEDPNNRVRANTVLALSVESGLDPLPAIRAMATEKEAGFRRSALYVIALLRLEETVPILRKLLQDQNESVRDLAFEVVRDFVKLQIPGAAGLHRSVETALKLERIRDTFFDNSFDQAFSRILHAMSSEAADTRPVRGTANPEREREALLVLAAKPEAAAIFPDFLKSDLEQISLEIARMEEMLGEVENATVDPGDDGVVKDSQELSEMEFLRMQHAGLEKRRQVILLAGGRHLFEQLKTLSPAVRQALEPELSRALETRSEHVPLDPFSVLPSESSPVPEIFDLTLRIYQKHVVAFSFISILGAVGTVGLIFAISLALGVSWKISQPLAVLLGLVALPALISGPTFLFGLWHIYVTFMIEEFLKGREVSLISLWGRSWNLAGGLLGISILKYLFLAGRFVLAMFSMGVFMVVALAMGGSILGGFFRLLGFLAFLYVFGLRFFPYLLVEPSYILGQQGRMDPFAEAFSLFELRPWRVITLYVFATLMMQLIVGTTGELIVFFSLIPFGTLMINIAILLSGICLYPMVYANMVVYVLMAKRESDNLRWRPEKCGGARPAS